LPSLLKTLAGYLNKAKSLWRVEKGLLGEPPVVIKEDLPVGGFAQSAGNVYLEK